MELEELKRGLTRTSKGLIGGRENGDGRELWGSKHFQDKVEG